MKDVKIDIHMRKTDPIPDGLVLKIEGQISTSNALQFQKKVIEAMGFDFVYLFFDCRKLSSISSSGIGAFAYIQDLVSEKDGRMILCGLPHKVSRLFNLLGFSEYFIYCSNIGEAIEKHYKEVINLVDDYVFPVIFRCPGCSRKQKATEMGEFQCADCKTALIVEETGDIHLK